MVVGLLYLSLDIDCPYDISLSIWVDILFNLRFKWHSVINDHSRLDILACLNAIISSIRSAFLEGFSA